MMSENSQERTDTLTLMIWGRSLATSLLLRLSYLAKPVYPWGNLFQS